VTPYATKRRPGFCWRSKTRQLHFVSRTGMLERRTEVLTGHEKLLKANPGEVERRHAASNAGHLCALRASSLAACDTAV
jgi:hypothetical protein